MADESAERIAEFVKPLRVKPGSKVNLGQDFDPRYKAGLKKREGVELLETGVSLLAEYQERLAAQDTYGVLLCLQALDAGGKDGTIRHVMSGVNPQGVRVSSFKVPSAEELDHDYLWRYAHAAARARRSPSSTARTTRRFSWCACTPRTSSGRSCRTTREGREYGTAATGRSTTGSATSRRTGSRW